MLGAAPLAPCPVVFATVRLIAGAGLARQETRTADARFGMHACYALKVYACVPPPNLSPGHHR